MVTKSKVVRTIEEPVEKKTGATITFDAKDVDKLKKRLPYKANSVSEIHVNGALHMLNAWERVAFFNECHRVLHKGGVVKSVTPHWQASMYYIDPAVAWPPLVENFFFALNAEYRSKNPLQPMGYKCDFDTTWGYGMHPHVATRNQEYQQQAIMFWKEAAQTVIATSSKR